MVHEGMGSQRGVFNTPYIGRGGVGSVDLGGHHSVLVSQNRLESLALVEVGIIRVFGVK